MKKVLAIIVVLVMAFGALACAKPATTAPAGEDVPDITIKIGSKDFTEQLILGQMAILALKEAGYKVEDKTNVAGSDTCRKALEAGEFDLYWEYTGTAWSMLLANEEMVADPQELFNKVKEADVANGITWLQFAPMNNTYALVMSEARSQELGITSYTELGEYIAANPGALVLACDHEFTARPDGLPGLVTTYGTDFGDSVTTMDMGIVFTTLKDGQADVGMVFATDGRIKANNLLVLNDDKSFFPIYNGAVCIRTDTLTAAPAIQGILEPIAALLTDAVMQELNAKVDIDGYEPNEVAEEFLRAHGFIA